MNKTFVLDTNILLSNPEAINGFEDNEVVITTVTLEELDNKKNFAGEVGYNARESIRMLDVLRSEGNLKMGISLPTGGTVRVVGERQKIESSKADNHIINICDELQTNRPARRNPSELEVKALNHEHIYLRQENRISFLRLYLDGMP